MNFSEPFRHNLRFWSLHVTLGAAMSFTAAVGVQFNRVQSVIGMIGGIMVFILLYTKVWSSAWFRRRVPVGSRWDEALIYGARTRSLISVVGIAGLLLNYLLGGEHGRFAFLAIPFVMLFAWDGFAGFGVGLFTEWCIKSPLVRAVRMAIGGADAHDRYQSLAVGDVNSLLPTFCITLLQGVMVSLYLLILSAAALGVMRFNRWRKARVANRIVASAALT